MKKITLLILSVLSVTSLWPQSYEIGFAGSGSSSLVDSVLVENLKQKTSVILPGTTILKLMVESEISAVNSINADNETLHIFPNPTTLQSFVQFRISKSGNVFVSVYDLCGKTVLQSSSFLNTGLHTYSISDLGTGAYIVRICEAGNSYSAILISMSSLKSKAKLEYVSSCVFTNREKALGNKSTDDQIEMNYKEGERLKLTGYSGDYRTILTAVPESNTSLTFDFMDCTDGDSNHYPVVTIGAQTWMAENLKTTHYSDGNPILKMSGNDNWDALTYTEPAYCWYNDDSATYAQTYGALYNWQAAMNSTPSSATNPSGVQGVCPSGWHLPSDAEWKELTDYLGGMNVAGGKLKETGTAHWISPNTGATNESGFTALPSGCRDQSGQFIYFSEYTAWWGATEHNTTNSWGRGVYYPDGTVYRMDEGGSKEIGISVRCVKDE